MENILYYLGAGASAQALPLAKSVYSDKRSENSTPIIPGLADELLTFIHNPLEAPALAYYPEYKSIRQQAVQLAEKAKQFGDVDTYAKYLQLTDSSGEKLEQLKHTLSKYFTIKQLIYNAIDKRYLSWMIGIMNDKSFPKNVKILNWNYDFQIQLAATEFGDNERLEKIGSTFSYSFPFINHYPCLDPTFDSFKDLSLIHLNGIAGYYSAKNKNERFRAGLFQEKYIGNHELLLKFLTESNMSTDLHFAWEKGTYHTDLLNRTTDLIDGTTIMVVIGYSFPFYNRNVDKIVFEKLNANGLLKKIYYQDPKLNGQQLYSQFGISKRITIEHIPHTENFHIPFEY